MKMLDYVESRAATTLVVLRQAYDDLHERAYKLATVLVAGGGAATLYSLGKLGEPQNTLAWAPMAALGLCWFGIAGHLVWQGATSRELSPGNGPANLLAYYQKRLVETPEPAQALDTTRHAELDLQQKRIEAYSAGCEARALAIDRAYKSAALCSPLVPAVVALACVALK